MEYWSDYVYSVSACWLIETYHFGAEYLFFGTLYSLCGFPPFFDDGSNMGELFEQILAGEFDYPEEYWEDVSDQGM